MQATIYIPDEVEGRKGYRERCTLQEHDAFVARVLGEEGPLLPKVIERTHTICHSLLENSRQFKSVFLLWSVEVFWWFFAGLAVAIEMWSDCPFELGVTPVCSHCYSNVFVVWNIVFILAWFSNLYLFTLLVSQGFTVRWRSLGRCASENAVLGIPTTASRVFLSLLGFLYVWIFVGVCALALSSECSCYVAACNTMGRSSLMYTTTFVGVLLACVLLPLGRLADVNRRVFESR